MRRNDGMINWKEKGQTLPSLCDEVLTLLGLLELI